MKDDVKPLLQELLTLAQAMDVRMSRLEKGQAALEKGQAGLELGQAGLKRKQDELESMLKEFMTDTGTRLTRIEAEVVELHRITYIAELRGRVTEMSARMPVLVGVAETPPVRKTTTAR